MKVRHFSRKREKQNVFECLRNRKKSSVDSRVQVSGLRDKPRQSRARLLKTLWVFVVT